MGENGVRTLVCFVCGEHRKYCLSTAALHTNSTRGGLFPTQPHKIEEQFKYWDLIYIISLKKKSGLPSAPQTFVNLEIKCLGCIFPHPPREMLYKLKEKKINHMEEHLGTESNVLVLSFACWNFTEKVRREGQEVTERSSLLFAKKAEPLFFVFLFVLLPFAGTGLAGDGDNAGGQGLSPAGCWRALGAGRHLMFIRGDGRGDGLDPCVHFLLDEGGGTQVRLI